MDDGVDRTFHWQCSTAKERIRKQAKKERRKEGRKESKHKQAKKQIYMKKNNNNEETITVKATINIRK